MNCRAIVSGSVQFPFVWTSTGGHGAFSISSFFAVVCNDVLDFITVEGNLSFSSPSERVMVGDILETCLL